MRLMKVADKTGPEFAFSVSEIRVHWRPFAVKNE
jgi:hypothetical protein